MLRGYACVVAVTLGAALSLPAAAQPNACVDGGSPMPVLDRDAAQGGIGGTGRAPLGSDGVGGTGVDRDSGGIGGTGLRPDGTEGGIGGTASGPKPPAEGGIGGTGITARAIIGVVTGFASICVGGEEVLLDANTQLRVDGEPVAVEALAVGQVVEIEAGQSEGVTRAQRVDLEHVVVGPVTSIDPTEQFVTVVGQKVQISEDTQIHLSAGDGASSLRSGDTIAVSGLRRDDGIIIASRITASSADRVQLSGTYHLDSAGLASVAGTRLSAPGPADIASGTAVSVRGHWIGSEIEASEVTPRRAWSPAVRRIDIEGYIKQPPAGDQLRVGDYKLEITAETRASLARVGDRQRVRFDVTVRPDGALVGVLAKPLRPLPVSGRYRPLAGRPEGDMRPPADKAGPASHPERSGMKAPRLGGGAGGRHGGGPKPPPRPFGHSGGMPPRPPMQPNVVRPPRIDAPHPPRPPRPPRM